MLQSNSITNYEIDEEIQHIMNSDTVIRKNIQYRLVKASIFGRRQEVIYNVSIMYNPENYEIKSKISYNTDKHGNLTCTKIFKKKLTIATDKRAPKALIRHLLSLYNLSWWYRLKNVSILNGSLIAHGVRQKKRFSSEMIYFTYYPCTVYEALNKAQIVVK
tara:strand:- start:369 stop:851 length:483 start_codon:yes stop_codon:yes gene_type:complete